MVAELSLRLAGGRDAPAEARAAFRRFHPDLPPQLMHVTALLVSELVSNAVRHADAKELAIHFQVVTGCVRVTVVDYGPGFNPGATPDPEPGRVGGWGLRLVDELATRWGVSEEDGARVWFEIDR